ncbi:MAG: hypothetical protein HWD60_18730 [Defluviicoccus sp.]|nr:MAG: hypothetical protein HWD60_18730 [Defluviicoccus sp.]
MSHVRLLKTSFAAGEIAPQLLGRTDLRAYDNGAGKLRNVFIHPTGGVARRSGLRLVDMASGSGRLVTFEFNSEQVYLLVFTDQYIDIYQDGTHVTGIEAPWTEDQLSQINWTQSADTLLVVHPEVAPRKITRIGVDSWQLTTWTFQTEDDRIYWPHARFAPASVTLRASGTSGTVTLTASASVFLSQHFGVRMRIDDKEVQITQVLSATEAKATVLETLKGTSATEDWSEQAFSNARGWPVSVCFHQDRLVIGGSRDLPNRLWLSKSADLFNFDLGEGLDDESIEFPILSDQVNAVRHVFSGRHLQVFTSGAEWMVTGDPLTPTSIQLFRQTRVGSPINRTVPPVNVDGATLFVPRSGPQLREFLFTDTEQAYQATDLAMLSHHLIERPREMAYDEPNRLLHVVMVNGTMATLTAFRDEEVSGWTLQQTQGSFLSVAAVGDVVYVLVERDSGILIEAFDDTLQVDAGLAGSASTPRLEWSGAGYLEGLTVKVVADGAVCSDAVVEGGSITLAEPASSVQMGLPFTHIVEPLPPSDPGTGRWSGVRLRPIVFTFRLWQTSALYLDTGRGLVFVPFRRFGDNLLDIPPQPFSGDVTVHALGWREGGITPLWRIEQDTPLPFTLLAVGTELSVSA